MATKLTDSNLKSVLADVSRKGFRTKFWREYRAGACKGSGVGKALDQLEKLGVPESGDPAKADLDRMPAILDGFMALANAMLKARGKCGKFQAESRKLCVKYSEVINKRVDEAEKLAQGGAEQLKIQRDLHQQRLKEEHKRTDEIIDGHKKELDEHNKLVRQELERCLKTMGSLRSLAEKAEPAAKATAKTIEQRMKQWASGRNREGVDKAKLDAALTNALKKDVTGSKVTVYEKQLISGVKLFDQTLGIMNGLDKKAIDSKTDSTARKEVEATRQAMVTASKEIKACSEAFQGALRVIRESPVEGEGEVQPEGM